MATGAARATMNPGCTRAIKVRPFGTGARIPSKSRERAGRGVVRVKCSAESKTGVESVAVTFQTKEGSIVSATAPTGKELRRLMLDNKVDVYTTWGKVWQCGGYGQCGTCIVEVVEGGELLSDRSKAELKHLKGKPESWRLACQTDITGESGTLTIKTKPQS